MAGADEPLLNIHCARLTEITHDVTDAFNRWENDPDLVPFSRPNQSQAELDHRQVLSSEDLAQRLNKHHVYLISLDQKLIGEMSYQEDPPQLYKQEKGTAWIGITIGEASERGRGVGTLALRFLEEQIRLNALKRIELGVFEFNTPAIKLYQKLGYREIGRIPNFTWWQNRMWQDIRMEKILR